VEKIRGKERMERIGEEEERIEEEGTLRRGEK
jgi:hypothetical protein